MATTDSPATKAATTRRRKRALAAGGAYGSLLRELWDAQQASDRAKSRAANGKHRREFGSYAYASHNYRASRGARERDYVEKGEHIAKACALLASGELSLNWGWQVEPDSYQDLECWGCDGTGTYFRACRPCHGKGAYQCSDCDGSGSIVCVPCAEPEEESGDCICDGSGTTDCPSCDGTGIDGGTECPQCGGDPYRINDDCECKGSGAVGETTLCSHCQGKRGQDEPCDRCGGSGVYDQRVVPGMAVLYVEIPTGQVSFHSPTRGNGPDYEGDWDGAQGVSGDRIVAAIDHLASHPNEAEQIARRPDNPLISRMTA